MASLLIFFFSAAWAALISLSSMVRPKATTSASVYLVVMAVPDAAAPGVVVALVAGAPVPVEPVAVPVWPEAGLPEVPVAEEVDPEAEPDAAA